MRHKSGTHGSTLSTFKRKMNAKFYCESEEGAFLNDLLTGIDFHYILNVCVLFKQENTILLKRHTVNTCRKIILNSQEIL